MHIVLDLDNTLLFGSATKIAGQKIRGECNFGISCPKSKLYMYFRPGLIPFLNKCFETFDTVSIWTAASKKWLHTFLSALDVHAPGLSSQFVFTYSWIDVTRSIQHNYIKDLSGMYNSCKGKEIGMNSSNIVLVDDSHVTYMLDPEHVVKITEWTGSDDDTALETMFETLKTRQEKINIDAKT